MPVVLCEHARNQQGLQISSQPCCGRNHPVGAAVQPWPSGQSYTWWPQLMGGLLGDLSCQVWKELSQHGTRNWHCWINLRRKCLSNQPNRSPSSPWEAHCNAISRNDSQLAYGPLAFWGMWHMFRRSLPHEDFMFWLKTVMILIIPLRLRMMLWG